MTINKFISIGILLLCSAAALANFIDSYNPEFLKIINNPENSDQDSIEQLQNMNIEAFSNEEKAEYYYHLSFLYFEYISETDETLANAQKGLQLITLEEQPWLFHKLNLQKIEAWDISGIGSKGLAEANQALAWAKENNYLTLQLNALYLLVNLYLSAGDSQNALISAQEGYKLAPDGDDEIYSKSHFTYQVGSIFSYQGEFGLALPYLQESYQHSSKISNTDNMAADLYELGKINIALGNITKGIEQLNQAIDLYSESDDSDMVAIPKKELAKYHIQAENYETAEELLNDAIELLFGDINSFFLVDAYYNLCRIYIITEQNPLIENCLKQARSTFDPEILPINKVEFDQLESQFLAKQNQFEKAYALLESSTQRMAEIRSQENNDKLMELKIRYDVEASNQERQLLANQNEIQQLEINQSKQQRILLFVLLISALIILSLLLFFIAKLNKKTKELHTIANFDKLTGLRSRDSAVVLIEQLLDQKKQFTNTFLAMIDIDYFKSINDQHGHGVGDQVLKVFGQHCQELIADDVVVSRFGGEEFVVFFGHSDSDTVYQSIEKLRSKATKIHEEIALSGLNVSFSAGICQASEAKNTLRQLLKCADLTMYQAKEAGRNQTIMKLD